MKYILTNNATFLLNFQSLLLSYPHLHLVFYLNYTDISKGSVIVPLLFLYSTFLYCVFYPGNLIYIYDFYKHPITDKSQFYIIIFDLFYSFRSTYLQDLLDVSNGSKLPQTQHVQKFFPPKLVYFDVSLFTEWYNHIFSSSRLNKNQH